MKRIRSKKLLPLILLLALVMTVGFAYLRTNLQINGSANFKGNTWNIYFDNVQVKSGSVTPVTAPTIPSNDKTTLSFEVGLEKPGDFYEFTVDIVNDGTIDAMIDDFEILPVLTEAQKKYIDYKVTYSYDQMIKVHDLLPAGTSETLKVVLKYKDNLDAEDLPSTLETISPTINLNYIQASSEAKAVQHGYVVLFEVDTLVTREELESYDSLPETVCNREDTINVMFNGTNYEYYNCDYKLDRLYMPGERVEVTDIQVRRINYNVCEWISEDNLECQSSFEKYVNIDKPKWRYEEEVILKKGFIYYEDDYDTMNFEHPFNHHNGRFTIPQSFTMPEHNVYFAMYDD